MSEKKMRAWLEKVQYHIEDYDLAMEVRAALAEPMVDDFKRGAEAMREAAAVQCEIEHCMGADASDCADTVRRLPIPEDK